MLSFVAAGVGIVGCFGSITPKTGVVAGAGLAAAHSSVESVAVTVPDANWHLAIERVYEREDAVWILAQLRRDAGPAAQSLRVVRGEIPVSLPAKPRRVFVAGKTWAWPNDEPVEFVASLEDVAQRAGSARVLFDAAKAPAARPAAP